MSEPCSKFNMLVPHRPSADPPWMKLLALRPIVASLRGARRATKQSSCVANMDCRVAAGAAPRNDGLLTGHNRPKPGRCSFSFSLERDPLRPARSERITLSGEATQTADIARKGPSLPLYPTDGHGPESGRANRPVIAVRS